MADITVKYRGMGSYAEPIIPNVPQFINSFIQPRQICYNHPHLQPFITSNHCSTSWITAIQVAAEAAMLQHNQTIHFSFDFIKRCAPVDDDGCEGIHPKDIRYFIREVGLMSEEDYESISEENDVCDMGLNKRYRFNVIGVESPNKGGLMNLISEGYPTLVLMSLNVKNLRFVETESNELFSGTMSEPSVMGVVKGYNSESEEPYWLIDLSVSPCEPLEVRLPMTSSETNANYGGIAGYAFGLEALN